MADCLKSKRKVRGSKICCPDLQREMEKKPIFATGIIAGVLLGLTACSTIAEFEQTEQSSIQESIESESTESQTIAVIETVKEDDSRRCEKVFGSYLLPQGWVEAETFSTKDKFFYVREGEEEAEAPDNISINVGKNHYAAQDHLEFRKAIMEQRGFP